MALKKKRAEEVAYNLLDISTLIGAPAILQSDTIQILMLAISDLPTFDLKLSIRGLWYNADCEQDKQLQQPPTKKWIPLHADQEYTIVIDIQRRGGNSNNVLCPRFPWGKDEGWFVTLGSVEDRELHALKRSTKQVFARRMIYTLYIMSDSYLGLDQQYDLQFDIIESLPTEAVEKVYDTTNKVIIE